MPIEEVQEATLAPIAVDPPRTPLGPKIIRNVMFGGLRYILVAPIPFIMTPLILHKIGVAGYGTWAVFLAINGLTSLADLGLVGTLSKFVAEYDARRDFAALERLLNSGLALFLLLALGTGVALYGMAPLLSVLLFRGSTVSNAELVFLFRCFLVVIATNILVLPFSSATSGLQRLDLTNMASAATVFLSALFSGILLVAGYGLRGLVYGYICSGILTDGAYFITVKKLLPRVTLNPLRFDKAEAKKMFGFSIRLYITQAAVAVHNQVEKVFLAVLIGVGPVGWYDIASDVALKIRAAIGFILTPVLPAASELSALGDTQRTRELYYRTHKYLALISVPAVCYIVVVSTRFVTLWLGPSLRIVALPLSVLVVVNFFNLITGPGFLIFAGSGHLRPGIQSALLGVALNIFLSLGLIYKFGFAGAVIGTAASLFLAAAFFVYLFHFETGYSFARVLRESYLKPVICSLAALALLLSVHPPRDLSWFGLVAMGAAFGALYSALILFSRFFDEYDWSKIEMIAPVIRRVRRSGSLG